MPVLNNILRSITAVIMIGSLLHLSMAIWESNNLFAEINEEIENVLEDESSVETLSTVSFYEGIQITEHWLKTYQTQFSSETALISSYFEITSPPPEFLV